jgi:argininosuccinate synthase
MGRVGKVVLVYSRGVETSVCIPYLKQEWGPKSDNFGCGFESEIGT